MLLSNIQNRAAATLADVIVFTRRCLNMFNGKKNKLKKNKKPQCQE